MCLGIPGRILGFDDTSDQLARADVMGSERLVNIALVAEEGLAVGDWVLIHLGFALEILDEDGAAAARAGLELMGRPDPSGEPTTSTELEEA